MAIIRRGYSDDFVLKNGNAGIGSADPQTSLDVAGVAKAEELKVTGVSSFTAYEGFLNSNHNIDESLTVNSGASLSGEIVIGTGVTATVGSAATGSQGAIDSLKVYNTFNPPVGGTNDRPIKAKPGQLYYNQDFKTIEFWDGNNWRQVDNTTQSGRMLLAGGYGPVSPFPQTSIEYFNIASTGNSVYFGDLTTAVYDNAGCSNSIRGISAGGDSVVDVIEYVTMASEGDAIDFGNLTVGRKLDGGALSNSSRGVFTGGRSPGYTNVMDTIIIMTVGNAVDFGDLSQNRDNPGFCFSNPTRGLYGGGLNSPITYSSVEVINTASGGNATEFPDAITARREGAGTNSQTKGVFAGGAVAGNNQLNTVENIIISSLGSAVEFGQLTVARRQLMSSGSNTRGIFAGGKASPVNYNVIDYINISSGGNVIDFGDLIDEVQTCAAFSDSHGGLGGF